MQLDLDPMKATHFKLVATYTKYMIGTLVSFTATYEFFNKAGGDYTQFNLNTEAFEKEIEKLAHGKPNITWHIEQI
jgi:hypothetical protein